MSKGKKSGKKTLIEKITTGDIIKTTGELRNRADQAFNDRHYLESAIIYFQAVEISLRIALILLATIKGLSKQVHKKIETEQSFSQLVLYLEILEPKNHLYAQLIGFDNRRNNFIHKLYTSRSLSSFDQDLRDFCLEGRLLIRHLLSLVNLLEPDQKGGEPD
jgi:hypothetical protein